ncbi:hypothetical protein MTO96_052198 [Rhipicephalus appendiculatus]
MCSSTCVRVEAARQARLTAPGCATLCSAVETDVAANPAGWDSNSRGPGSGHDPRGPHPVGLVPEHSLGYCTLAGAAHQASSSDLGGATGTGPWTGPPGLEPGQARPVQRPSLERRGSSSSSAVLAASTRERPARRNHFVWAAETLTTTHTIARRTRVRTLRLCDTTSLLEEEPFSLHASYLTLMIRLCC